MIEITKNSKTIKSNNSLIFLGYSKSQIEKYLNKEELNYVESKFKDKKEFVAINRLNHWVFIIKNPSKKVVYENLETIRLNAYKIHSEIYDHKIKQLSIIDISFSKEEIRAFIEALELSAYKFTKYLKNAEEKISPLEDLEIISNQLESKDLDEIINLTSAVSFARDMINEPVNYLNATKLAETIQKMGKIAGFKVEVFTKAKIEKLKMGGLLAVNKGSIDPPTFSVLTYKPVQAKNKKPIVLVGKGLVFDTGGLSLKPTPDSMDHMKCDMSGAATVAGTIYALAKSKANVYVIGLVPSTDNRPDGNAYTPGDIIRMHDGSTVEVLNTDAEGRLILADALSYAKQFQPQLTFTIATLTGAAAAAIGKYGIVTMGNADIEIMDKLKNSGNNTYERVVEFPFWNEYNDLIKSEIADLKNVGGKEAGAITAGKFLEHFTDYPFIHLDIAGPAFVKEKYNYRGQGGTGIGIRLLYDFFKNSN